MRPHAGAAPLVVPSNAGTPMLPENLHRTTLKPAAEEAGVPWAAFHSFRHACASMLTADGRNIVQVSRWLGHHSPSFTLDTYAHLMDEGVGAALDLVVMAGFGDLTRRWGFALLEPPPDRG